MPDRRVVGTQGTRIPRAAATAPAAPPVEGGGGRRRRRWVIIAVAAIAVAAVVVAVAALVGPTLRGGGGTAQSGQVEEEAGPVVAVEPVSVNLADGHYLRVGFSMRMTDDALPDVDIAPAQDTAIGVYSGQSSDALADTGRREELRTELVDRLSQVYDGQVTGVYFTDFVTQ